MIVIDLNVTGDAKQVELLFAQHQEFLNKHYANKLFLFSGPKVPFNGGVIIALSDDSAHVAKVMRSEPFVQNNIAEFCLTTFKCYAKLVKLVCADCRISFVVIGCVYC